MYAVVVHADIHVHVRVHLHVLQKGLRVHCTYICMIVCCCHTHAQRPTGVGAMYIVYEDIHVYSNISSESSDHKYIHVHILCNTQTNVHTGYVCTCISYIQ